MKVLKTITSSVNVDLNDKKKKNAPWFCDQDQSR